MTYDTLSAARRSRKLVLGVRIAVHLLLGFFVDNRFEIICMFVRMFVRIFVHTSPHLVVVTANQQAAQIIRQSDARN